MSGGAKTLLFILLLPFLAGLGHDLYLNYFSDDEKIRQMKNLRIDPEEFMVSDLGWIWDHYHPASMETARTMVEAEVWKKQVDPVLQLPTMLVGVFPFALGLVYIAFAFILGVWPFTRYGQLRKEKAEDYAVYKHAKTKSVQYTKK